MYRTKHALEGYTLRLFTKTLGWSKEDTDALVGRVWEELQQKDLQLYLYFYLLMGRAEVTPIRSKIIQGKDSRKKGIQCYDPRQGTRSVYTLRFN